MPLTAGRCALGVLLLFGSACGDHYEGGGRRREVPKGSTVAAPAAGVSLGEPSSQNGGSLASESGAPNVETSAGLGGNP